MVRKSSVKDANAEYVQRLRVPESATNEEIQAALHKLFNSGPQGPQDQKGPQGQSVLQKYPQGINCSTNDNESPQGMTTNSSILAATAISKIQLDNTLKNSLISTLQTEAPYLGILNQLSTGMRQIVENDLIFKRMNSLLVVHD